MLRERVGKKLRSEKVSIEKIKYRRIMNGNNDEFSGETLGRETRR